MRTVAALYVDTARGPYRLLPAVELWGFASKSGAQVDAFAIDRDADAYAGPHPCVAHPPCGPWGKFAFNYKGGEGAATSGLLAVESVRRWGGVLEHPEGSRLWQAAGLPGPGQTDGHGGRTVRINQCDFGHRAMKPTWLYVVGAAVPAVPAARAPTRCMVRLRSNGHDLPELPRKERHLTPVELAAWLVDLARSATLP